jgi:signal transduction histidine kinase
LLDLKPVWKGVFLILGREVMMICCRLIYVLCKRSIVCLSLLICLFSLNGVSAKSLHVQIDTNQIHLKLKELDELIVNNRMDTAERLADEIIEISGLLQFDSGVAMGHMQMSRIHYMKGNYQKSLHHGLTALPYFEKVKHEDGIASATNIMGLIHLYQKELDLAIQDFNKAVLLNLKLKNNRRLTSNYINLGIVYRDKDLLEESTSYFRKARELSEKEKYADLLLMAINHLGNLEMLKNQPEKAITYFDEVIHHPLYKNDWELSFAHTSKAYALQAMHQYAKALTHGKLGLDYAKKGNMKWDVERALDVLREASTRLGDYRSAYHFLEEQKTYGDSLMRENNKTSMDSLRLAYERSSNEALIKENQLTDQKLKVSQLVILLFSLFMLFLSVLLWIVFKHARNTRLLNEELKKQSSILQESKHQIQLQNEALQEVNATKDYLFSIISHDLKGPFLSLLGLLDLLKQQKIPVDEVPIIHQKLYDQTLATSQMVDKLLLWAHSQQSGISVNPKEVALIQVVEQVLFILSPMAQEKEIAIHHFPSSEAQIWADADQVQIIIENILNNAIKFTPPQGQIHINYQLEEAFVILRIKDTGLGMSEEKLQAILQGKAIGPSSLGTNNERGIGLGMALVNRFMEINQARMEIHSRVGEGTVFVLHFPRIKS